MTPKELSQTELWIVDSGFAYGALTIKGHEVIDCAPIFRKWFLGQSAGTVRQIVHSRHWKLITEVKING